MAYRPEMAHASWQPQARVDDLVQTVVDDELLVYDLRAHHLHLLNSTSWAIWALCDGTLTVAGIGPAAEVRLDASVPEEAVWLALGQLADADLLAGPIPDGLVETAWSPRTLLHRAAGAGTAALPALDSITAPVAPRVSSRCLANDLGCDSGDQCCSGQCWDSSVCAPPTSSAHRSRSCIVTRAPDP